MMKKRLALTVIATALLFAGIVFSTYANGTQQKSSATTASSSSSITIGATLMDAQTQWFQWVKMGMDQAAKEDGVAISVVNTQGNPGQEVSAVEDFTQKGVSAIVIGASSPTASVNALKQAEAKGIKVVAYNSLVGTTGEFTFVGVDNTQLGILDGNAAKDYINKNLGGKAKVAVVYSPKYGAVSLGRSDGFLQVMKTMPGVQIVDKEIAEAQATAENMVQNILTAHPDVQIMFCWNESSFEGALDAIKVAGMTKKLKVFGVDMSPKVTQAFQSQEDIGGVATQEPVQIGYTAVKEAVEMVQGKTVAKDTRVPVVLVTNANLASFLKTHPYYNP